MLRRRRRAARMGELRTGIARVYRHVAPYLRLHRGLAVGSGAALVGATLLRLAEPWPLKLVIDNVIDPQGDARTGIAMLDGLSPAVLLAVCAGFVLAIVAARALCEYLSTVGFALTGSRVLIALRQDLYGHLQRLSLSFHDRARAGDLTIRVVNDISSMREAMVTAMLPFATNVLVFVGMASVMLLLDWRLALVALVPLPLLAFTTVRLGRRIQTVSRELRKREGGIAATTAEVLGGIREIQALSLEDRMANRFARNNQGSLSDGVKAKRLSAALERATDIIAGLSTALTLWYGAVLVLRGDLSVGDLVVFLAYLKYTFRPIRDFAKNSSRIAKATAAGERIADLFEEEAEVCDRPDAVEAPAFAGRVVFDAVHFSHGPDTPVIEALDLTIAPHELVALVGPSGAGKSTIASLLSRLYDPLEGAIRIDGYDLRSLTLRSLRKQIGVVLQDHLILADTVAANISLAAPDASPDEIEESARLAGAHEFIMALPQGYDTPLTERGGSLSAGQRQRIVIARAALRAAPILVLDEPTTGLDPESEVLIGKAIQRLAERATVILITHDMGLAAAADRVVVLEGGRIAEEGAPQRLLAEGGRFAEMTAKQPKTNDRGLRVVAG